VSRKEELRGRKRRLPGRRHYKDERAISHPVPPICISAAAVSASGCMALHQSRTAPPVAVSVRVGIVRGRGRRGSPHQGRHDRQRKLAFDWTLLGGRLADGPWSPGDRQRDQIRFAGTIYPPICGHRFWRSMALQALAPASRWSHAVSAARNAGIAAVAVCCLLLLLLLLLLALLLIGQQDSESHRAVCESKSRTRCPTDRVARRCV
jgi:hypothetical protein